MRRLCLLTFTILSLLPGSLRSLEPGTSKVRIAAVQTFVDKSVYASEQDFTAWAERLITAAKDTFHPDLVVFPEYIGALFVLFSYPEELAVSESLDDFIAGVRQSSGDRLLSPRSLFFEKDCGEIMDRIWGSLAAKHNLYILGGSYFAPEGKLLFNRAVVYGPDGNRMYRQDKVFIAPLEKDFFRLSGGTIQDASPFEINGRKLALTICRDTYYAAWEEHFAGTDAWINIKANNEPFGTDRANSFTWSLVDRTRGAGVPRGISACLTGELIGLRLEGKSVIIRNGIETFADSSFGGEILVLDVD